jgi:hypothetical protein
MDFVDSLESQMLFCVNEPVYRCGVYLKYIDEEYFVNNAKFICEIVKDMCNENELYNDNIDCIRYSKYDSCVRFKNGSFIKIIRTSDNARGHRFNGIIIDNKISIREKNDYIYPYLIPLRDNDNGLLKKDDKPFDRIFTCDIDF